MDKAFVVVHPENGLALIADSDEVVLGDSHTSHTEMELESLALIHCHRVGGALAVVRQAGKAFHQHLLSVSTHLIQIW
jgi:hypothetical protein